MQKIKVLIEIEVKADIDDPASVTEAVYAKVAEAVESEELEFSYDLEDDEDDSYLN